MEPDGQRYLKARITKLPDNVVAQIASSITIKDLRGVVQGLLRNSLDAGSTKVEIDVDFTRGNCVVEDNGCGISAEELLEDGGLGNPHWTSKAQLPGTYGFRGTFLSTVAALATVTITSNTSTQQAHRTLVLPRVGPTSRALADKTARNANLNGCGTRVEIRDLFSTMPVRARELKSLDETGLQNEWDRLTWDMVALLLASTASVHVWIQDKSGHSVHLKHAALMSGVDSSLSRKNSHRRVLGLLTQAGLVLGDSWPSWTPLLVVTRSLSIRGAISLDPAPSQNVQFISIGREPVSRRGKNSELYETVNAVFSSSKFGYVYDEDGNVDELEVRRRRDDKRYKCDGPTLKQMKSGRKGLDRWPMFYIRVDTMNEEHPSTIARLNQVEDKARLSSILRLLETMITQWLTANDFSPRGRLVRSTTGRSPIGKRREDPKPNTAVENMRTSHRSCRSWTRMKCSRSNVALTVSSLLPTRRRSSEHGLAEASFVLPADASNESHTTSPSIRISNEGTCAASVSSEARSPDIDIGGTKEGAVYSPPDDYTSWIDPDTGQLHLLNICSGTLVTADDKDTFSETNRIASRHHSSVSQSFCDSSKSSFRLTSTLSRPKSHLGSILDAWQNPVFETSEATLARSSYRLPGQTTWSAEDSGLGTPDIHPHHEVGGFSDLKLSSAALNAAEVISQVNNKFILARLEHTFDIESYAAPSARSLLVLIDQHAADERIRVEALFQNLCLRDDNFKAKRPSNLGMASKIHCVELQNRIIFHASKADGDKIKSQASRFAQWGVLYDHHTLNAHQSRLEVFALPSAIAERCSIDQKVLIELLRTEAWQQSDRSTRNMGQAPEKDGDQEQHTHSWLKSIGNCPSGIIEMLNSRSCRSAIMFNDDLSRQDCEALQRRRTTTETLDHKPYVSYDLTDT
ncbi:MAG: DNA mismatch repair protein [Chrysothrix sp. TS-e1954]|nr:MAG: DNA mismatch repair protein [Chrysothrix sp. TS-e1954]